MGIIRGEDSMIIDKTTEKLNGLAIERAVILAFLDAKPKEAHFKQLRRLNFRNGKI